MNTQKDDPQTPEEKYIFRILKAQTELIRAKGSNE